MKVLVACEESQAVSVAFRRLGHEAYSCDILPCSGGHPEWHIQDDVLRHLEGWDMILAFPPCTHLASSGARWFKEKRADGRQQEAIDFFISIATAPCNKIAIENPVGIMSTLWQKPSQIIQPWMFGHAERKTTCLWLQDIPNLEPTNVIDITSLPKSVTDRVHRMPPSADRSRLRSKTYQGVADAMADQWGNV